MVGNDGKSTDPRMLVPPPLPLHGEGHHQTSWILLDLLAYVADVENLTSAWGETSHGVQIRVTFCTAPPPLVSYLCVWCPDQKSDNEKALRVGGCVADAADSDLVFLYISINSAPCDECFVYKVSNGGRGPSLRRLELPYPYMSTHHDVALVPHRDVVPLVEGDEGGFSSSSDEDEIVVQRPHAEAEGSSDDDDESLQGSGERFLHRPRPHGMDDSHFYIALLKYKNRIAADQHEYELCVFHSTDGQWRHLPISVGGFCRHLTYKAINLGQGGLVGFVDPWRGIIVCDLLDRRPARYLPLPAEIMIDDNFDMPLLYRDIALLEGRLTLVELYNIVEEDTDLDCPTWEVTTWSRKVTGLWEEDWCQDYVLQSGDVLVNDAIDNVNLLPKVVNDDGTMRPTLEMPYIAHPSLSLNESHVVYMMGKVGYLDKKVLVMSVDIKERMLQAVTMFDAERMVGDPFDYAYVQSRIPKYFNSEVGENLERPGTFCTAYPCKLHVLCNEAYMEISGGVEEQHEAGSSKRDECRDNTMDVD